MRSGRRLAIDVGSVRIGVAVSDFHGILASGLETIDASLGPEKSADAISKLIEENDALEVYVGLPLSMSGEHNAATAKILDFVTELQRKTNASIRLIDERLTTVTAGAAIRSSGKSAKTGRAVIDQIAAAIILEQALQMERTSGLAPGKLPEELDE